MTPSETQTPDLMLLQEHDSYVGAQMLWSATGDPNCRMNGGTTPCGPYATLNEAMELAIAYNLSFLEIYPLDIVNPNVQSVLELFYQSLNYP